MTCLAHPFDSDAGATCTRTDEHVTGHVYVSAWAPDALHNDGVSDQ